MKKALFITFLCLIHLFYLNAQVLPSSPDSGPELRCGSTELMLLHPELLKKQALLEEQHSAAQKLGAKFQTHDYVLPVVVHIIHQNGAENISDAQVIAAIEHLNQAYAHEGYYAGKGDGAKVPVQFCLARRDPDGNATNGITRTESVYTDMLMELQDGLLKDLNRWDPFRYVNIWVVREISSLSAGSGVAGYAFLPSAHGQPFDGMVCEAQYFGVSPDKDVVAIHEMGHYLGLYHTFEGGCKNDDCSKEGDRVCDTPPDNARHSACIFNSCSSDVAPGSPFTSDVDDFTGDFMDYSPFSCYYFFTQGQADRMSLSLEQIRGSLLNSNGCLDPCTVPLSASFSISANPVPAEQNVSLLNTSSGANSFEWLDNGVAFSQLENPVYAFPDMGKHLLTLKISNDDPNCKANVTVVVDVKCAAKAGFTASTAEAIFGTDISFTNTSIGNASTVYEWSVNGHALSNNFNYNQLFASPGVYAINLNAITPVCNNDTTAYIKIKGPCADVPEPVQLKFSSSKSGFSITDMLALPDGGLIFCGRQYNQPVLVKCDEVGQVVWKKVLDLNGGQFFQIAALPDGGFILSGFANQKQMLCKTDASGEIIWVKTLENTGTTYHANAFLQRMIAVNPDGSFGVIFNDPYNNKYYLSKVSAEGEVLWSKRFNQIGVRISLQIATDGTGDFLLLNAATFLSNQFGMTIYRIGQDDGKFLSYKTWNYLFIDFMFVDNLELMTHPDGGFSIFFMKSSGSAIGQYGNYLSRCTSSGTTLWTKRYLLPAPSQLNHAYIRAIPNDKGWYILDERSGSPDSGENGLILQRLSNEGVVMWERKWGEAPVYSQWSAPPVYQSARARGIVESNTAAFDLISVNDDKSPMSCFPLIQPKSEVQNISTYWFEETFGLSTTNLSLHLDDLPVQTMEYELTSTAICAEILPCKEVCDNQIDDDGDFFADCYDDECSCHLQDTVCIEHPETPSFSMKHSWNSAGNNILSADAPLVANLNPQTDSIPEILVGTWTEVPNAAAILILKGDGSDKNAPKLLKVPGSLNWRGPTHFAVADMNHDGLPEIVAQSDDYKIHIFTHYSPAANPPMQLWVSSGQPTKAFNGTLSIADFDGDNVPEVVLGSQIFKLSLLDPAHPTLNLVLTGTAGEGASSAGIDIASSTAVDMLSTQDCFGDTDCNGLELVAGTSIYSVDLSNTDGDGFQIKEKYNLNQVDPSSITYSDGFTAVADVNLDGSPDVVVNTSYYKNASDYSYGVAVWDKQGFQRFYPTSDRLDYYGSGGNMLIANVFDDRKAGFAKDMPEIIVLGFGKMYCFNENKASKTPSTPWWWTLVEEETSGRTGTSAFDFNGDGLLEIVYRDEKNLQIIYGDAAPFPKGVDEKRRWAFLPLSSITGDEYPVIANVDADPEAEIVASGSFKNAEGGYYSGVSVSESDQTPWQPARRVWNQYNYFNVNINDDLSVPATQAKHWLESAPAGSNKRPFNTNLVQGPAPDSLKEIRHFTPDATLSVDSVFCQTDSLRLYLRICNQGNEVLPAGTPIAFYKNDPTVENAPLLMPPALSSQSLEKGNCLQMPLSIPAQYNSPVFIVVNDDGNRPRPYALNAGFQQSGAAECRYENNLASFVFPFQAPALDLGPDRSICGSSVLTLSAGPLFQKYVWQDFSTDSTFTAFNPGKYWVTTKDACGFAYSDTLNIALNTQQALDLPEMLNICKGESASLAVSGFAAYQWAPTEYLDCADCAEVVISPPASRTLFLTAREGDCFVTDSVRIIVNALPVLAVHAQDGNCDTPAQISVQANPGNATLLWSTGQSTDTIYLLDAGTYTVTATDANNCISTASATVNLQTANDLQLNTSVFPIPCGGGPGMMAVGGLGGSGQYTYQWSNGESGQVAEVWTPGEYTVTLTDMDSGCTKTASLTVGITGIMLVSAAAEAISCFGLHDGSARAQSLGGIAPFAWQWSGGEADSVLNHLGAGIYSITMTDSRGCTGTSFIEITEPPVLSAAIQAGASLLCPGESTDLSVLVGGGTAPFLFSWNTGDADSVITQAGAGVYKVTITDAHDCTVSVEASLEEAPDFQILVDSVQHASGAAQADGAIFTHVEGGLGPFQALWSNGDTTLNINMLLPGEYMLTVTDTTGCVQTQSVEVKYTTGVKYLNGMEDCEVYISPNPGTVGGNGALHIDCRPSEIVELQLFEVSGKRLWIDSNIPGEGWQTIPIQAPNMPGVYFLHFKSQRICYTVKWVIH